MDCAEAKLQIESYVAGEIADDQKGPLEEHLAACAECRLDSELTRASRNQPDEPGPNDAPAAFVESIRPDAAEPGVASEAGEFPAGPKQAADGSWTLESIFGAGGAGVPGPAAAAGREMADGPRSAFAERAAAAAEPLPEPDLPSILSGGMVSDGTAPDFSDEPPASDAPTWDFEPAEVKGGAKPPQGSLFFAEEALSRSGARKKSGVPKVVVWGAGGLVGVGLLALSIWIAMTVRQPLPEAESGRHPMRAGTGPAAPGTDAAVTPPPVAPANPATAANEAPTDRPSQEGSNAPSVSAKNVPDSNPAASPPRAELAAPPPAPKALAAAPSLETAHAAVSTPTHKPAPVRETATSTASKPPATTKPAATHPGTSKPAPAAPKAESKPWPAAPVLDSENEEEVVAPPRAAPKPSASAAGSSASPAVPLRTATPPGASTPAASGETTSPAPSAPADLVERPIDRLHLATLKAEQNADLAALRKLRDTWRGFVKTSIGPDRSRAKRELADCLWAVQTLTTKSSDQKEALAAYRDYVLNAPAGGADARTVARMRMLEDAVAESH